MKYRVACYRGGGYLGVVAPRLGRLEKADAEVIACRYNAAYPYSGTTFWAVEVTEAGCVLKPPHLVGLED